jgi:hypothetical protein
VAEEGELGGVGGEGQSSVEGGGLVAAAEPFEGVASNGVEEVVAVEERSRFRGLGQAQAGFVASTSVLLAVVSNVP